MEVTEIMAHIQLIEKNKKIRHNHYAKSVAHASELGVHVYGDSPVKLLTEYRPNEPKDIHDYRQLIFMPITKSKVNKIMNVLAKIKNPENYSIKWDKDVSNKIDEGESLQEYTEEQYPFFGSLMKWLFEAALKRMLADPNAIVAYRPLDFVIPDNELIRPYGFIYTSEQVVFYSKEVYIILVSTTELIKVGNEKQKKGKLYHIYTKNEITEVRQTELKSDKASWEITELYKHNFNEIPIFHLGGEFVEGTDFPLYESFIAGVLPFWNDAIREFSDKQATFVQHIYLERVELQVECDVKDCQDGFIHTEKDGKSVKRTCTRCKGTGYITGRSPYGITVVKDKGIDPEKVQFPGVEYIAKPTDIVKLLKDDIKELIDDGFSAINMDVINKVGENQSGIAKVIDRTDLDNYLQQIADNLFNHILKLSYKYINLYRYTALLNEKELQENLPVINSPTRFDVISMARALEELKMAGDAGIPDELVNILTLDIINKRYPNDHFKRKLSKAILELDPMPNKAESDKALILQNGGVTKIDYIVSTNIKPFILRAIQEDDKFLSLERDKQIEILTRFAEDKLLKEEPVELNEPTP